MPDPFPVQEDRIGSMAAKGPHPMSEAPGYEMQEQARKRRCS